MRVWDGIFLLQVSKAVNVEFRKEKLKFSSQFCIIRAHQSEVRGHVFIFLLGGSAGMSESATVYMMCVHDVYTPTAQNPEPRGPYPNSSEPGGPTAHSSCRA